MFCMYVQVTKCMKMHPVFSGILVGTVLAHCVSTTSTNLSLEKNNICCQTPTRRSKKELVCYKLKGGYLNLSNKRFEGFPWCQKSTVAKDIKQLDLDNNLLKELDSNLFMMTQVFHNLISLMISRNRLVDLQKTHGGFLSNLRTLDLSQNSIHSIDANYFVTFPTLRKLNLRRNKMKYIHLDIFKPLKDLEEVDLSFNEIEILQILWFQENSVLRTVKLTNNLLNSWTPLDAAWPKSLTQLNLSMNQLPGVPPIPDNKKNGLWFADLSKNPIWCGCRLPKHDHQIILPKVACGLRLKCDGGDSLVRDSIYNNCSKEQEERGMKWLSAFVNQPICTGPQIVSCKDIYNNETNEHLLSSVATGFPAPTIKFLLFSSKVLTEQQPFGGNLTQLKVLTSKTSPNLTCQARNLFGTGERDFEYSEEKGLKPYENLQFVPHKSKNEHALFLLVLASMSLIMSIVVIMLLCSKWFLRYYYKLY